jgi:hypothetical protein
MPFRNAFFKSFPELRSWHVTASRDHFHNQHSYKRKPWELRCNGYSALWVVYSNTALYIYDTVQFAKVWRELCWLTSGDTCRYESSVMMDLLVCDLLLYDATYSRRFSQNICSVRENRWIPPARVRGIITHGTKNLPLKRQFLYNLINPILLRCATYPWVRGPGMFVKQSFAPPGLSACSLEQNGCSYVLAVRKSQWSKWPTFMRTRGR